MGQYIRHARAHSAASEYDACRLAHDSAASKSNSSGRAAITLSTAGQDPNAARAAQFAQLYGVDPETARMLMAMLPTGGGSAMTPGQQSQMLFQPPAPSLQQNPLLASSAMPTFQQPYTPGVPRMDMAQVGQPMGMLPPLGRGAFPSVLPPGQTPYGSFTPTV
jgi:hypothetical protein